MGRNIGKRYAYNPFTDYGSKRNDDKARQYDAGGATRDADSGVVPYQQLGTGGDGDGAKVLKDDGTWGTTTPGSGDVTAASTIADNRLVRGDGGAKGIQQSGITVDDSNNLSGVGTIASGAITSTGGIAAGAELTLTEQSAPGTPASGKVYVYAKSDGKVYRKDDAGTEAELGGTGGSNNDLVGIKTADETITSDNTLTIDADVQVTVAANEEYALDCYLLFSAHTTPDYKLGWSVPAGCEVRWNHTQGAVGATPATESTTTTGTAIGLGNEQSHSIQGTVRVGATAGAVGIAWAQNTSDTNGTRFHSGSWIRLTPRT